MGSIEKDNMDNLDREAEGAAGKENKKDLYMLTMKLSNNSSRLRSQ